MSDSIPEMIVENIESAIAGMSGYTLTPTVIRIGDIKLSSKDRWDIVDGTVVVIPGSLERRNVDPARSQAFGEMPTLWTQTVMYRLYILEAHSSSIPFDKRAINGWAEISTELKKDNSRGGVAERTDILGYEPDFAGEIPSLLCSVRCEFQTDASNPFTQGTTP